MAVGITPAKKVMVVADPTRESAAALQYAISHVVLEKDELILLHVENPASWRYTLSMFLRRPSMGSSAAATTLDGGEGAVGEMDFLEEMKNACKAAKPTIQVRTMKVLMDAKDKATTILSQSKIQGIEVIIVGQRRSLSTALLGYKRQGGANTGARVADTAEYLIENSQCTCVGVQRKGQKAGYVLNSKTYRNFWLLA